MAKIEALAKTKGEESGEFPLRSKRYIFFIVLFMGLVGLMDQYLSLIESVIIVDILSEYGLQAHEFAFWQGIFGIITFAVFGIAWFSDAYGRKKAILILIVVMGITALLIPLIAINIWIFLILYSIVILGTLSNLWEIPVMEESPANKRALNGSIAFLIGVLPVFAILGPIIAQNYGWKWCYGIMFFMMIFLIILWFFMKEPERWKIEHAKREHKMLKFKEACKSLTRKDLTYLFVASLVYGIWTVAYKLALTWGGYYYVNVVGLKQTEFNRILLIGALFLLGGAITSGILMEKLGRKPTLLIGCVGAVIGYIGLGLTTSPAFYWMIYFFMPVVFAWIMVYFSEIFPTKVRGTCVGITTTAARVSYVLGPLFASLLLFLFVDMVGFWIIGGLTMIIPIFSLILKPHETKGQSLEKIQEER